MFERGVGCNHLLKKTTMNTIKFSRVEFLSFVIDDPLDLVDSAVWVAYTVLLC